MDRSGALLVSLLFAVVSCGGEEPPVRTAAAAQASCPSGGARVPFAQLIGQAETFRGCDVTTEVAFVATGKGPGYFMFDTSHQTVFQVVPPGEAVSSGPAGLSNAHFASLPDEQAATVFQKHSGDRFVLRGRMEFRRMAWADQGNYSRLFRAQNVL